jgi:hypothetical protein
MLIVALTGEAKSHIGQPVGEVVESRADAVDLHAIGNAQAYYPASHILVLLSVKFFTLTTLH